MVLKQIKTIINPKDPTEINLHKIVQNYDNSDTCMYNLIFPNKAF